MMVWYQHCFMALAVLCLVVVSPVHADHRIQYSVDFADAAPHSMLPPAPTTVDPAAAKSFFINSCHSYTNSAFATRHQANLNSGWNVLRLLGCLILLQDEVNNNVANANDVKQTIKIVQDEMMRLDAGRSKKLIAKVITPKQIDPKILAASQNFANNFMADVLKAGSVSSPVNVSVATTNDADDRAPLPLPAAPGKLPENFGMLIFPGFQTLDVFGPLDFLNLLSILYPTRLALISETLQPVPTKLMRQLPIDPTKIPEISESLVPTHTLQDNLNLDVLIVPGGGGTRKLPAAYEAYIRKMYPNLKYLLTVCTGSAVVARSGLLDGKRATSNKASWKWVVTQGPKVKWVPEARWTKDGNIWTSSGISAGMDLTYEFIHSVYSPEVAKYVADLMEYEPHRDEHYDPFHSLWSGPNPPKAPVGAFPPMKM